MIYVFCITSKHDTELCPETGTLGLRASRKLHVCPKLLRLVGMDYVSPRQLIEKTSDILHSCTIIEMYANMFSLGFVPCV